MNFKNINIKNYVCYYFDCIMRVIDINPRDILLDETTIPKYFNSRHFIQKFFEFSTTAY